MKNFRVLSFAAALLVSAAVLTSCGKAEGGSSSDTAESKAESVSSAAEEQPQTAEKPDLARSGDMRGMTPAELVADMKTGWNLGNTLDATGGAGVSSETSWGNPATTKEMIDAVKAGGFDMIRIPITWGGHMGAAPDYTVDEEWFGRVQEVVNYAYDNDMYVIINSHHEEDWRIPDNAHIDAVDEQVGALWGQIAERFKDYGDHLIFEGLNEPRVKNGTNEWNGGTEEGRRCLDRLNQTFVDAVRATGGNNESRLLLVTTFASSCVKAAINDVAIPDDKNIAFSIHAYTPYAFTYNANADWELFDWDGSHDGEIDNMFYDLKEAFLDKGIPVIITEYGAVNKDFNDEEIAKWLTHYLGTAKSLGIPCVWWDNGYYLSGNELFGLFDRKDCDWFSKTELDAIMKVYE